MTLFAYVLGADGLLSSVNRIRNINSGAEKAERNAFFQDTIDSV